MFHMIQKIGQHVLHRDIHGVGVDTPSIDYGQSRDFTSHVIFNSNNVWGLENLKNTHMLPPKGFKGPPRAFSLFY